MTKRKSQDLWNSTTDALDAMANEQCIHLLSLRMQKVGSTLKNVKEVRETKKRIARILTILKVKKSEK